MSGPVVDWPWEAKRDVSGAYHLDLREPDGWVRRVSVEDGFVAAMDIDIDGPVPAWVLLKFLRWVVEQEAA